MQRIVRLLLILAMSGAATAVEPERPENTTYAVLNDTLAEQILAAAAEKRFRDNQRDSVNRLNQLGQASADELWDANERAIQATEWSELLNLQQTRLLNTDHTVSPRPEGIVLRVPGLPAAFFDDSFSTVLIPSSDHVFGIVAKFNALFAERHSLFPKTVHQQRIADRQNRRLLPPDNDALSAHEIELDILQHRAASLEPTRLEEVLLMPIQYRFTRGGNIGMDQSDPGLFLFSRLTRDWILDSRRVLAAQAERTIQRLQKHRQLVVQFSENDATSDADISFLDAQLEALRRQTHDLHREIYVAGDDRAPGNNDRVSRSSSKRLALLMKMMKGSYDQSRIELAATTQQLQQAAARQHFLQELSEDDATFAGELSTLEEEIRVAAAVNQQQTAELSRRRALVEFAMAVYRMESGRDRDTVVLNAKRAIVFSLHADRQPEIELIAAHTEVVQRRVTSLQRLYAEGYGNRDDVNAASAELEILKIERRRAELQMDIAVLCNQLLQMADTDHVLAQR